VEIWIGDKSYLPLIRNLQKPIAMKTQVLLLSVGLLFLSSPASSAIPLPQCAKSTPQAHKSCLELTGTAELNGKRINQYCVKLYIDNVIVKTSPASSRDKFKFILEENRNYTLCFSKPGCIDRLIRIDTYLPDGVEPSPPFEFDFQMEMLAESNAGMQDTDFPAGLIVYDPSTQKFESSRKYMAGLKKVNKTLVVAASK
jgi:hypothetical protein